MVAMPAFVPEDPQFYQDDPHSVFRRLRAEDPLHWSDEGRFWCVTKHADIQFISQRPRLFSSERGTQLFEVAERHAKMGAVQQMEAAMADTAPNIIRMEPAATQSLPQAGDRRLHTRAHRVARAADSRDLRGAVSMRSIRQGPSSGWSRSPCRCRCS